MQEVFNKKDLEIMDTFYNERCITKRTQYGYNNSFSLYIQYTKMHLQDLLMEADIEEEKGVRYTDEKVFEHFSYLCPGRHGRRRFLPGVHQV